MMKMTVKELADKISEKGLRTCFSLFLRIIKKQVFGMFRVVIFEYDLDNNQKNISKTLDIDFRFASKKDFLSLENPPFEHDEKTKKYALWRLDQGDTCIFALHNQKVIGYIWIMYHQMELSPMNYSSLASQRAYVYNIFITPLFRKKNMSYLMDEFVFDFLKSKGFRYVVSTVEKDMFISMKSRCSAGFKPIGQIIKIRCFGLKYDYVKKKIKQYLATEHISHLERYSTLDIQGLGANHGKK